MNNNSSMRTTSTVATERNVVARTKGRRQGPITRLVSPGDLGELIKPFVFLDYFEFDEPGGFAFNAHPHSGIATHTTFLDGAMDYGDSTGKTGSMGRGSVEWMQAGSGVWHWGRPRAGTHSRGYQLWVALPPELELEQANSMYVEADDIAGDGRLRALIGDYGDLTSPVPTQLPMTYVHVRLANGELWTYQPPDDHDVAWLAVNEGRLHTAGVVLEREIAVFAEGNIPIKLRAEGQAEFVIGSARKHPHQLILGPSSVHTSEATLPRGHARITELADTPDVREARRLP
jgi:redox-sensitive bicupin YhaK (pirin superfamily)